MFELGNVAATLLILRATDLLTPGRGHDDAAQIAIALYVVYNLAATLVERPGRAGSATAAAWSRVLAAGVAAFALAYAGFAAAGASIPLLAVALRRSPASGSAASRPPSTPPSPRSPRTSSAARRSACWPPSRASATSPPALAGLLYTLASPAAAFAFAAALMVVALGSLATR